MTLRGFCASIRKGRQSSLGCSTALGLHNSTLSLEPTVMASATGCLPYVFVPGQIQTSFSLFTNYTIYCCNSIYNASLLIHEAILIIFKEMHIGSSFPKGNSIVELPNDDFHGGTSQKGEVHGETSQKVLFHVKFSNRGKSMVDTSQEGQIEFPMTQDQSNWKSAHLLCI